MSKPTKKKSAKTKFQVNGRVDEPTEKNVILASDDKAKEEKTKFDQ